MQSSRNHFLVALLSQKEEDKAVSLNNSVSIILYGLRYSNALLHLSIKWPTVRVALIDSNPRPHFFNDST